MSNNMDESCNNMEEATQLFHEERDLSGAATSLIRLYL